MPRFYEDRVSTEVWDHKGNEFQITYFNTSTIEEEDHIDEVENMLLEHFGKQWDSYGDMMVETVFVPVPLDDPHYNE